MNIKQADYSSSSQQHKEKLLSLDLKTLWNVEKGFQFYECSHIMKT